MTDRLELRQRIANLSPEQRIQLERWLMEQAEADRAAMSIRPRGPGSRWPLSFAQQRLWVLHELEPGLVAYNIARAFHLRGPLDVSALGRALDAIVERHESLRTTFATVQGDPVQVVGLPRPVDLCVVDVPAHGSVDRAGEVQRLLREEARRPFDLSSDLMLRGRLLRLGPAEHILSLTMHHIASDGWSMGILERELGALYGAFAAGEPSPLPALPIQYADYAVWHRRWFEGVAETQLEFWRDRLAGAPPVLELPSDRSRPAAASYRGDRALARLPADLVARVGALARSLRATPFMALLAVFKLLLARYSGRHDVVVGTAIAGRTRVETETLIGFFVNTLVLRTDLSGDPTVRELVGRVRATALGAYGQQEMPFERLVQELKPERLLDRSPLIQVAFVMQEAGASLALAGLEAAPADVNHGSAQFDLAVSLIPESGGLTVRAIYSTDLFDAETIDRMLAHYRALLERAVADPAQRTSALPWLDDRERRRVLSEWNPPAPPVEASGCLHRLFEAQARRTPGAIAVVSGDEPLSYAELDRRANRLAHHLRRLGAGPEALVGVFVAPGADLVVALLGVLKSGAGYLPLDPAYPTERLAFMLEDAGARILVVSRRGEAAPPRGPAAVVAVDGDDVAREPDGDLDGAADEAQLAYAIYTSGSSGRPKGVMVSHANVTRLLAVAAPWLEPSARDCWTLFHSVAFDFSVWEIWGALLHGGRLVVVPPLTARTPAALLELLRAEQVTVLNQTPSAFRQLMAEDEAQGGAPGLALRAVVFGGEALDFGMLRPWVARRGAAAPRLINMYGITETTVHVTWHEISAGEIAEARGSVIGRPLADLQTYVLDARLEPVPIGVPGEVYVGGAGVARGYLNRPELTAERFVPDPHGSRPGGRLYRTGDRARWRRDGCLEYLGRLDEQVKIRGYRIELGEIEVGLRRHPAVRDAVVAMEERAGDRRLVAYLVAADAWRPDSAELRAALHAELPSYMVPASFAWVDALPLTSSGKVDRRALARLAVTPVDRGTEGVAPRTPMERQLAAILSDLLGVPEIGVHDNFFDVGGHSMLAVRVVARLSDEVRARLPLRSLFESPTIAELAQLIEGPGDAPPARAAAPSAFSWAAQSGPLPLSHFQEQFWLINQEDPGDPAYNNSHAMRLRGALVVEALRTALTQFVERHEVLRTVFALIDGEPRQTVCPPEPVDVPLVDLTGHPDAAEECARLTDEESQRPFDLGRDRMLRARLFRLDAREHVLVLVVHHIASDLWSTPVLFSELGALYDAAREGAPSPLPPLPLQYAEFAVWQRRRLDGNALDGHLDYWRQRLAGAPAALALPTDRPRQPRRSAGQQIERILPAAMASGVRSLGARSGATPFMTLLAGFAAVLHRYTGAEDMVIGAPALARDREEVRRLIGCFVNMIALRVDLSGDPPFRELVARVRTTALEAYDHKDAPFPRVVEAVRPPRVAGRSPVFHIVLNMRDAGASGLRLAGLETEPAPRARVRAMFDLMLYHHEVPDGGIRLAMEYATDLFESATIERMLGHLQALLESALAEPDTRLSRLTLLTEPERRALAEGNDTASSHPASGSVHALFEAQADARPEAIAAVHGGRELAYGALEERANRLAHHLRALGAGPDVAVGLCVQRSLDMLVGVLGILKAGAGYVPLDPAYPRERLAYMIETARLPLLVSHRATTSGLPLAAGEGAGPRVVCLDRDAEAIAAAPPTRPTATAGARDLLYLLFTSGSTGRPKGVAMPHGPLVNLMRWQHARSGCGVGARTLQFAPYSFDVSCQELFATLGAGGALVVVDEDTRLDPEALLDVMSRERVERVFMPFVALEQLAQAAVARGHVPETLREVITAGEQLRITPALAELFRRLPGARLDNQYGPTECHAVSAQMLDGAVEDWPAVPGIGRPVANVTLHVLGAGGQPQPVGVPGELYVGGVALARGYLRDAELTAQRFVADHVSGAPGARLYRTGDLARRTAAGDIDFLGRIDEQVKVRGYRVEPGEIETALERGVDAVSEAVVLAREDAAGGHRLVAYLRAAATSRPDAGVLRTALRTVLPDYMVPSAFQWVEAWPLTPSGKVDRRALAAGPWPEHGAEEPAARAGRARNPLEVTLVGIWEELLGVRPIGIHDSFFEQGGHSLLAVRMLRRVEEECRRRLPVATLYAGATIAHLAEVIRSEAATFYAAPVTEVQKGRRPPFFFLHGDYNGGGFYCIQLARALGAEQTFYALHPHGPDGRPVPATIEGMAEEHLAVVQRLQPTGPYYLGGHCNGGLIAYEMARRLRAQGETVAFVAVMDASAMNTRLRSAMWRMRRRTARLTSEGQYYARRARRLLEAGPAAWAPLVKRQIAEGRRAVAEVLSVSPPGPDLAYGEPSLDEAYWRAIRSYVPGRYDGLVTVFRAAEYRAPRPDIGWGMVAGTVETHEIPGTHLSFITLHVRKLAERMRDCLGRAQGT